MLVDQLVESLRGARHNEIPEVGLELSGKGRTDAPIRKQSASAQSVPRNTSGFEIVFLYIML